VPKADPPRAETPPFFPSEEDPPSEGTARITMYYLYILLSEKYSRHYIGITGNLEKRLEKHNTSSVRSTKAYAPWKMVYSEEFLDKRKAGDIFKENSEGERGIV